MNLKNLGINLCKGTARGSAFASMGVRIIDLKLNSFNALLMLGLQTCGVEERKLKGNVTLWFGHSERRENSTIGEKVY